jgi:hypothetical protein
MCLVFACLLPAVGEEGDTHGGTHNSNAQAVFGEE